MSISSPAAGNVVPIPQAAAKSATTYFVELTRAMGMLAENPNTVFIGQAVAYPGQIAYRTFELVPADRRIELPVCEDLQVGLSTGLAMAGFIPVSFFPRWDFLMLAANQIVNHLDKLPAMGWPDPKVIIRTSVGRNKPLDAGPQHTQNHSAGFRQMLTTIQVVEILKAEDVLPAYRMALKAKGSFIMVERQDRY